MLARTTVLIATVMIGLLTATVSLGVDVKVDFDPTVDFSNRKTFSWMEGTPVEDPEIEARIHAAIERELIPLGMKEVREDPDVFLVTHASLDAETLIEVTNHDYWVGYRGWKRPIAVSEESWTAETGMLIVDLVDASSNTLIWRGIATGNVAKTDEKRDRKLDKTMAQLFGNFPPKYKSKPKVSDGD